MPPPHTHTHPQSPPPGLLHCHPPSLHTLPCPACMPSPFATGGTVPQPVSSAMLCKPCPLVYAPTPHTCPPTVPSTWTTPMPPPQFTHPTPPACPLPLHTCQGCRRIGGTHAQGRVMHKGRGH